MVRPLGGGGGGGGGKGWVNKKKLLFFEDRTKKIRKGLSGRATKKITFLRLTKHCFNKTLKNILLTNM